VSETSTVRRYMKKPVTRLYTATVTIEVVEDLESSWHPAFTEAQAKRLAKETLPGVGGFINGGSYAAAITRVSIRKEVKA
jgi:hypothetical protein